MTFGEGQEWENHVLLFLTIIGEPAAQDQNMNDAEKVTEVLRTLSSSFGAFAMASKLDKNYFHQIVNAVQTNIERRVKIEKCNKNDAKSLPTVPVAQLGFTKLQSEQRCLKPRGRGVGQYKF